jgi:DNA-binding CsgD family transcriptional regulator
MPYPAETHRGEIEERTRAGESCEQIAEALRVNYGVEITYKTISRKRCEWGLRSRAKRPPNKNPSIRKAKVNTPDSKAVSKAKRQASLREEITARTERGQPAQQIADELTAEGYALNKGVSTVLRLQTFWSLIPYDQERATKGTKEFREKRKEDAKARRIELKKQRAAEEIAQKTADGRLNGQASATIHYPSNCTFGPSRRVDDDVDEDNPYGDVQDESMAIDTTHNDEDDYNPLPPMDDDYTHCDAKYDSHHQAHHQAHHPSQDYSRDIMSANLMVDLAVSMLSAAKDVKDVLLAAQFQRPASHSTTGEPPSVQEVTLARRKLKEATRCAWDLAKDGVLDDV